MPLHSLAEFYWAAGTWTLAVLAGGWWVAMSFWSFGDWNAANWVSLGAAFLSLGIAIYNNRVASGRERQKTRREEFNRRIAAPIELALEDFGSVGDELHAMKLSAELAGDALDRIQRSSGLAQRKLSARLRRAATSQMCVSNGWDTLGGAEYDEFVAAVDALRVVTGDGRQAVFQQALDALEQQDRLIRLKIDDELAKYI